MRIWPEVHYETEEAAKQAGPTASLTCRDRGIPCFLEEAIERVDGMQIGEKTA